MLNNITITIFDMQQKFTRHGKKQENVIHNQKKNQWIKTDPQVTKIELEDKDFRTSFINMLKCVKWNISLKKESENIKKNRMKLLGMKIYIIYEMKKLTNWLHTTRHCSLSKKRSGNFTALQQKVSNWSTQRKIKPEDKQRLSDSGVISSSLTDV